VSLEQDVRDYLRGKPALMALLNDDERRLNMDWSGDARATHVTLYRAGGQQDDYIPYETAVITLHTYGTTRPVAADLADAVALEMRRVTQADKPLLSASIESINWLPTADGGARYVVTTVVTARTPVLAT
jgi:hypothetical protein